MDDRPSGRISAAFSNFSGAGGRKKTGLEKAMDFESPTCFLHYKQFYKLERSKRVFWLGQINPTCIRVFFRVLVMSDRDSNQFSYYFPFTLSLMHLFHSCR